MSPKLLLETGHLKEYNWTTLENILFSLQVCLLLLFIVVFCMVTLLK